MCKCGVTQLTPLPPSSAPTPRMPPTMHCDDELGTDRERERERDTQGRAGAGGKRRFGHVRLGIKLHDGRGAIHLTAVWPTPLNLQSSIRQSITILSRGCCVRTPPLGGDEDDEGRGELRREATGRRQLAHPGAHRTRHVIPVHSKRRASIAECQAGSRSLDTERLHVYI